MGNNPFEICPWSNDEISSYIDVLDAAFSEMHPKHMRLAQLFPWWRQTLWVDDDLLWCAKVGQKPVGVLCSYEKRMRVRGKTLRVGHIGPLGVHPSFWRRGIARSLMEKLIDVGRDKGFDALTLFADLEKPPRILYDKLGFKTYYTRRLLVKVLDAEAVAAAVLNPFLKLLVHFVNGVKQKNLPRGCGVRPYRPGDQPEILDLSESFTREFDCVDVASEHLWQQKLETYPKPTPTETFVLLSGGDVIGNVFTTMLNMIVNNHPIRAFFITDLFFRGGHERAVPALVSHALKEAKRAGAHVAVQIGSFSPSVKKTLKDCGFTGLGAPSQLVMYKPLREEVTRLFHSIRTYYEFLPIP